MFGRTYIVRATPAARFTPEGARKLCEQAITTARACDAKVALMRPATLVAIMAADPRLLDWERCGDGQHRPTYRSRDGRVWTIEPSETLYPNRVEKVVGAFSRSMHAVR